MKRINKILILLFSALAVAGCQNNIVTFNKGYDDGTKSYGPPSIDKVTLVNDADEIIDQADMGQMISIYGDNLAEVVSLRFNDRYVDLSTIYAVRDRIVVSIPREYTDPDEAENKFVVTTKKGTAEAPLLVTVPPLVIDGLYNEFADPGSESKIVGDNFDIYSLDGEDVVLTVGGAPVEIESVTQKELIFTIPETTAEGVKISISSPLVDEMMNGPVDMYYRVWGVANILDNRTWGDIDGVMTDGSNDGDPIPNEGITQFMRVATTFPSDDWKWAYGGRFDLEEQDVIDNPQDYVVKMEVLTKRDRPVIKLKLVMSDMNQSYEWYPGFPDGNPDGAGVPFNTYGEWKTITFELSDLFDVSKLQMGIGDPDPKNEFGIAMQPYGAAERVDMSLSNARIVRKNP